MLIIHNLIIKFTATHIVAQYIIATHKSTIRDKIFNKSITTPTHIVVKLVYTKLVKIEYSDKIWKIWKRSGYKPNRFRSTFKFDMPYEHTNSKFVFENE